MAEDDFAVRSLNASSLLVRLKEFTHIRFVAIVLFSASLSNLCSIKHQLLWVDFLLISLIGFKGRSLFLHLAN